MKRHYKILIIFICFLIITSLFLNREKFFIKNNQAEVIFQDQNLSFKVELAKNQAQWTRGLMFRDYLPVNNGMLFIFPDENLRSFWMKNMKIPLDMLFISADKKIIDIKENFAPCLSDICESYFSAGPAKYVLEINAGLVKEKNIKIGEEIRINYGK